MAIKKSKFLSVIFFIFLTIPAISQQESPIAEAPGLSPEADNLPTGNFRLTEDKKFIQRLSWSDAGQIKFYKVEIQKRAKDSADATEEVWEDCYSGEQTQNFLELSLSAGLYRMRVQVVNLFDETEEASRWKNFEVFQAYQPQVDKVIPQIIYLNDKNADGKITLFGNHLFDSAFYQLRKEDGSPVQNPLVLPDGGKSDKITLQVDLNTLEVGNYKFFVQNPGGLSIFSKEFEIAQKLPRKTFFTFSLGYCFPYELYDGTLEKFTKSKYSVLNGKSRMSLYRQTAFGGFGLGLDGQYSKISATTDKYDLSGHNINALLVFVYSNYIIEETLRFEVFAGAGCGLMADYQFKYKTERNPSPEYLGLGKAFGGGIAIQYFIGKRFYIEANTSFTHVMFDDMTTGTVSPGILAGIKL